PDLPVHQHSPVGHAQGGEALRAGRAAEDREAAARPGSCRQDPGDGAGPRAALKIPNQRGLPQELLITDSGATLARTHFESRQYGVRMRRAVPTYPRSLSVSRVNGDLGCPTKRSQAVFPLVSRNGPAAWLFLS